MVCEVFRPPRRSDGDVSRDDQSRLKDLGIIVCTCLDLTGESCSTMTILDAIEMSNDDRQYFGALHSLRVGPVAN